MLSDATLVALIRRGYGRPWNGYELRQMKMAGKYPPERLTLTNSKGNGQFEQMTR